MSRSPLSYGPFISRAQAKACGAKTYFTGQACKHGHITERRVSSRSCGECSRIEALARRNQNPEKARENARQWKQANKTAVSDYNRAYGSRHRPAINARANKAYLTCPAFRTERRLRSRLYEMVTKAGCNKTGKFRQIIDIDQSGLMAHIAGQFSDGMSWGNMGEWHIDHIRPCASFDLSDPEQQRECFHYTNLQPLWAEDNLAKSDSWDPVAA